MKFKLSRTGRHVPSEEGLAKLQGLGFRIDEELISFVGKHGPVIVNEESIEIYDGYRE